MKIYGSVFYNFQVNIFFWIIKTLSETVEERKFYMVFYKNLIKANTVIKFKAFL